MRIVFPLLILLIILVFPLSIFAQSVSDQEELIGTAEVTYLRWGGVKNGWKSIYKFIDTTLVHGEMGKISVSLADNSAVPDKNTEILINFDSCRRDRVNPYLTDYRIEEVDVFPSRDVKLFGSCSGGFVNYKNTVKIKVLDNSFFFISNPLGSFTIDFYIYPTSIYDDSEIIGWRSPVVLFDGEYAGIRCYFKNGRLTWSFEKVFFDSKGNPVDFKISEIYDEIPYEWHYHALIYNSSNGLMTLMRDGKTVGLKWLTENFREDGTLLRGKITRYIKEPIILGRSFLGYMDEFRVSRGIRSINPGLYRSRGYVISDVLEIGRGSKIIRVKWESSEEMGTLVKIYYRLSDVFFPPDAEETEAETEGKSFLGWRLAYNGTVIQQPPRGRFLQWKAELFGTANRYTPLLDSLEFLVELDRPPLPPLLMEAKPLDGGVRLKWVKNKEKDVAGYRIYYGPSSHYYFGDEADLGPSPIEVGNIDELEIKGLENEKVYFFALTAVDKAGLESGFSREIAVRPSSIYAE